VEDRLSSWTESNPVAWGCECDNEILFDRKMAWWKYTLEAREINLSIKWRLQYIGTD